MSVYVLKSELKILKAVKHQSVSYVSLCEKYPSESVNKLLGNKYLTMDEYEDYVQADSFGFAREGDAPLPVPYTVMVHITRLGLEEIDRHEWFDLKFIVKNAVIPIIVSIITTLITLFLKGVL